MARLLIFGGTTEGREEALRAAAQGKEILVSVTSEYARFLLPQAIPCRVGELDTAAMAALMASYRPDEVVDATHPFAVRATANILKSAGALGLPYRRVVRQTTSAAWQDAVEWADSGEAAAQALCRTVGPVLLTTGSHTVGIYAGIVPPVRLLPTEAALQACREAGLAPSHVLAMQGPFTEALNGAVYDQWGIRVMVSKDSGQAGGVEEKVRPALAREIHVIMIRRPKEEFLCVENR